MPCSSGASEKVAVNSSVAQLVERVAVNHQVAGSSPAAGANDLGSVAERRRRGVKNVDY